MKIKDYYIYLYSLIRYKIDKNDIKTIKELFDIIFKNNCYKLIKDKHKRFFSDYMLEFIVDIQIYKKIGIVLKPDIKSENLAYCYVHSIEEYTLEIETETSELIYQDIRNMKYDILIYHKDLQTNKPIIKCPVRLIPGLKIAKYFGIYDEIIINLQKYVLEAL